MNQGVISRIFKAYDVRGEYGKQLTQRLARTIGFCAARWLTAQIPADRRADADFARIVVGNDMRPSGKAVTDALIDGIRAAGANVVYIGMVDTPMTTFAVRHLDCCGGIMVTASHNPPKDNGFKVSGIAAAAVGEGSGLFEIRDAVAADPHVPSLRDAANKGTVTRTDLTGPYREHVLRFVRDLRPMKVAVDASNGMAGKMLPALFGGLPVEILPLNFTYDGTFRHGLNPMEAENIVELAERVRASGARFGACFDGDADRCVLLDEQGRRISSDLVTAVLAVDALKAEPGAAIVYDLRSSRAVAEAIRAAGGRPIRERVGHAFMKAALKEHNAILGGELSGHYYFRENGFADSGMILFATMLTVLSHTDRPISELIAPLAKYHTTGELNFEAADKDGQMRKVAEHFASGRIDRLDGVTIEFDDWWLNLRPSNTEAKLRLNLEANTAELRDAKLAEVTQLLGPPLPK